MSEGSRKAVIVKRPTRLQQLITRFNTREQARFYIERLGGDFSDYEREHDTYLAALEELGHSAQSFCRTHILDWNQTTNYLFSPDDLVLTVGQDGLIVNTLKYLKDQAIIGFNSDPERWDGNLAQFRVSEAKQVIESALAGTAAIRKITKAIVRLSDKQELVAVNDFFLGVSDHSSARYSITQQGKTEQQSSSGLIVSTPLGRSGWMKSVITGATGVMNAMSKNKVKIQQGNANSWDDDKLFFAVREPFPSINSTTELVFGTIQNASPLVVESKMGERGIIFSDGVQSDFLHFNYSIQASISVASHKGLIVVRAP